MARPVSLKAPLLGEPVLLDGSVDAVAVLRERAHAAPGRLAVEDGARRLSRANVYGTAMRLAHRIAAAVPAGTPVGVAFGNDAFYVVAAYACAAAGCPHVGIDRRYPYARNEMIARLAGIGLIVAGDDGVFEPGTDLAALPHLLLDDASLVAGAEAALDEPAPRRLAADDPFVLLFTSGSTGVPKGAVHTQRSLSATMATEIGIIGLEPDDRLLMLGSPTTISGARVMLMTAYAGAATLVRDPRIGLERVLDAVRAERATIWRSFPALMRATGQLEGARDALRSIRLVQVAGDRVFGSDVALLNSVFPAGCRLAVTYGSTEAGYVSESFATDPSEAIVPLGEPVAGVAIELVDERDGIGELVVRNPGAAVGFWRDGAVEPRDIVPVAGEPLVRSCRTGDLFRRRPDGTLAYAGRADRTVKIVGQRADLGDVEAALRSCAGVADAAVVARTVDGATVLTAFVAFAAGRTADLATVRRELAVLVPSHMLPAVVRAIDAIPYLPGFKADRAALERLAAEPVAPAMPPSEPQPGDGAVARAVTRAWTELLGASGRDPSVRWNEAGGDSLRMLQLAYVLARRLDRDVPLELFESSMLRSDLVERLDRGPAVAAAAAATPGAVTIVVLPGVRGDEPRLVDFRASLGATFPVVPIGYPGWEAFVHEGATFDALVAAAADEIVRLVPAGALALVGYSFGGLVAHGAAARLEQAGRTVRFLGLLDSDRRLEEPVAAPLAASARLGRARTDVGVHGMRAAIELRLGHRLARLLRRSVVLRRLVARNRHRLAFPAAMAFELDRLMTTDVLAKLAERRRTPVFAGPATLYRAADEEAARDGSWRERTPALEVETVAGTHFSLLIGAPGRALAQRVVDAVAAVPSRAIGSAIER